MMPPQNRTVSELSEETGITAVTLYAWRRQAREKGVAVPGDGKQAADWSSSDKFRMVLESAALSDVEVGEYCRRKGVLVEQLKQWREACEQTNAVVAQQSREARVQAMVSVPAPQPHHGLVLVAPFGLERVQLQRRFLGRRRRVDALEGRHHRLAVFRAHITKTSTHQMHDAQLGERLREHRVHRLRQTLQAVHAGDVGA